MPASSKTDPPLAKAKPIRNSGSASGITSLRRGGKLLWKVAAERGMRCERNSPADTQVSAEGGAGGSPGTGAEIPLQPLEKTMVRQAVPLQPMEVYGGADIYLQPLEDPTPEQVDAPKGGCDPVGSPRWSRLLAGPVAPWKEEPTMEQLCLPVASERGTLGGLRASCPQAELP
ncbi:epimerase family protein SDR39U1 [Grus japonensis]|uniref:Epimerase family protein SDR39U1 n=1 Tax=Grus japonensis TaxID=30415 RepID=A0ABC9WPF4_GRUJA